MDAQENGNAPAYPRGEINGDAGRAQVGLTKREAFAMSAMQGLLAFSDSEGGGYMDSVIPGKAVRMADALLDELAKPQED